MYGTVNNILKYTQHACTVHLALRNSILEKPQGCLTSSSLKLSESFEIFMLVTYCDTNVHMYNITNVCTDHF